jgi:hypothetical protein
MKHLLLVLGLGIGYMSFTYQSDVPEIINALKSANAEAVSGYFDSYLDLTLPGNEELKNIGINQAGIALKQFFSDAGVHSFNLTSQRKAGTTMYLAGKLNGKSRSYNVTLLLRNKEGRHQFISMRIN